MSTLVLPISGLPWGHLKNKNWLISSHLRGLGGGHNICYVWGDFCCDFCIRSCRWGQAPCPPLAPSWPQSQASLLTGLTCEGWLTFVLIFFFTSPVLFTSFSFFNLFFVDPRTTAAASACSSANEGKKGSPSPSFTQTFISIVTWVENEERLLRTDSRHYVTKLPSWLLESLLAKFLVHSTVSI